MLCVLLLRIRNVKGGVELGATIGQLFGTVSTLALPLVAFRHRLDFNSALVAATAKERAARRSKRIFDYLVQKQVLSSHVYDIIKIFL